MIQICFSVLHYKKAEITKRCVSSLTKLKVPNDVSVKILIVDNASPDNSGLALKEHYKNNSNIEVLFSKKNLGFARGNNISFSYMKENIKPQFAIFLNNDTEIVQQNFIETLLNEYIQRKFDVLSIDTYDPSVDQHQAPICLGKDIDKHVQDECKLMKSYLAMGGIKKLVTNAKSAITSILLPIPTFKKKASERISQYMHSRSWENPQDDVVVQGSCVIFSESYIQTMPYAFYPKTKMYFEEACLKLICDYYGFRSCYTPHLQILHHHYELNKAYLDSIKTVNLQKRARLELESSKIYYELKENIANGSFPKI